MSKEDEGTLVYKYYFRDRDTNEEREITSQDYMEIMIEDAYSDDVGVTAAKQCAKENREYARNGKDFEWCSYNYAGFAIVKWVEPKSKKKAK